MTDSYVNPDSIIETIGGQMRAGDYARFFGVPTTSDGKVPVPQQTKVMLPGGSWATAGGLDYGRSLADKAAGDKATKDAQDAAKAQEAADAQARKAAATKAAITNLLRNYNLGDLTAFVDRWARDGLSDDEVMGQLYDWTSDAGKVVDKLYPELRMRAEAGKRFMPIAEIQEYVQTSQQIGRSVGLPESYYSREAITKRITGDVSIGEFKDRADEYASLGLQELDNDPLKQQELEGFERFYNVKLKPGEIAGMIFDTDLAMPTVQKRISAVRLDAAASRTGFGDLTRGEAEHLAGLGIDAGQAVQGFEQLAGSDELFQPLDGSDETIGRGDQLAAAFEGSSQAQQRIQRQARRRVAGFESGGGFATDNGGFAGVGVAR